MTRRTILACLALALFLLPLASARAAEPAASPALAPAAAEPTAAALPPELMAASPQSLTPALEPRANFCTKEVCSVNRMACKSDCLPCSFSFQCNFPVCNSCQCLC
ncbi:MAG: hypothetical protein U0002_07295 [Thermoanaerobaculia bacterium]